MDKCRKANLYQKMGYYNEYILCKFEESLKYYKKALKIDQELVHPSFIASSQYRSDL
ncbi:hypothetical protein rsib_orf692 [Rickettsia sibirica 246]|uniref:Tetratricopeptide repeat family protein n=1 Tax=Rickettsia sibirica (strain ATCC VR-151 / 246) TaxID=272951 RepID=Q7PAD1_RICS2|nr:hypothetical protein rsib_orf692 [Rickettsia sibirica 246]